MLRKTNSLLLVIFMIALTSCSKDFLETKPTDAISSADALATPANMGLIIQGLHRGLYSQTQNFLPGGNSAREIGRAHV